MHTGPPVAGQEALYAALHPASVQSLLADGTFSADYYIAGGYVPPTNLYPFMQQPVNYPISPAYGSYADPWGGNEPLDLLRIRLQRPALYQRMLDLGQAPAPWVPRFTGVNFPVLRGSRDDANGLRDPRPLFARRNRVKSTMYQRRR